MTTQPAGAHLERKKLERRTLSLDRAEVSRSENRGRLSIGIVIPVYNEKRILEAALERVQRIARGVQVVVVDGGSTDGTARIAARYFPTMVATPRGRGLQMNRGAAALDSDVLLFLHADSVLPEDFEAHIQRLLARPRAIGGCFRLRFDVESPMLRFYTSFTKFPGRFFHFGDQAFFVRREVFRRMGGFRDLPFLEDVDFLRRLRGKGKFAIAPIPVLTSARRFQIRGIVRQMLWNIAVVVLFELGVPAHRLARFYPPLR